MNQFLENNKWGGEQSVAETTAVVATAVTYVSIKFLMVATMTNSFMRLILKSLCTKQIYLQVSAANY